jgi:hypothetical protein
MGTRWGLTLDYMYLLYRKAVVTIESGVLLVELPSSASSTLLYSTRAFPVSQSVQAQLSPCSPVRGPMAATRPYPSDISILKVPKSSSKPFFDQAQLDGVADFAA